MQHRRPTHDQPITAHLAAIERTPVHVPRPAPICASCTHFQRDAINPAAGMGPCSKGHGYHYPHEHHWCVDHDEAMSA